MFLRLFDSRLSLAMLLQPPGKGTALFEHNLMPRFLDAFYLKFLRFFELNAQVRNRPEDRQTP